MSADGAARCPYHLSRTRLAPRFDVKSVLRLGRGYLLVAASVLTASAQEAPIPTSGLSALPEAEVSQLSQQDPNPLGEKALAIRPEQWKHGETDHFIYHFVHSYVATPVSVEAEFHYRVVAKEIERDQPAGDTKSHIYIFERPEEWQQFQAFGK